MTERRLVFLIGAVQFINILDFMMVMPLGPDFARELGIPTSNLGIIGGSYTLAASVAGVAGAFFLDRFDRRKALAVALAGLVLGTVACGFAVGLNSLIAARVVAGAFGGPATAIALAIISDVVPPARRGRAMGAVMGAFSIASVLGVPAGLELAELGGWRMPFFTVGALGVVVAGAAIFMMEPQTTHLMDRTPPTPFRKVIGRSVVRWSLTATAFAVIANFALIPNLSAYFQFNRGYPRDDLSILYLVGGAISFATLRIAGALTDRHGTQVVSVGGAAFFGAVMVTGFIYPLPIPVIVVFVCFMVSGSFRIVPLQAMASRVPAPSERARFMSAQSAVQHLASSIGAILGATALTEAADHSLVGVEALSWFALVMAIALPLVVITVERKLAREAAADRAVPVASS